MAKCKWENGYYVPCGNNQNIANLFSMRLGISISAELKTLGISYCPICGADIREPESEVIIKESSETWVAKYEGIDYLWTAQARLNMYREKIFVAENGRLNNAFKPISEIEITDEIAKLHPKIMLLAGGTPLSEIAYKAIYVKNIQVFYIKEPKSTIEYYSSDWAHIDKCRLATVDDLED